jgi:hypothetical protein
MAEKYAMSVIGSAMAKARRTVSRRVNAGLPL